MVPIRVSFTKRNTFIHRCVGPQDMHLSDRVSVVLSFRVSGAFYFQLRENQPLSESLLRSWTPLRMHRKLYLQKPWTYFSP